MNRFDLALHRIVPPGSGCHASIFAAACVGVEIGLTDSEIVQGLKATVDPQRQRQRPNEILETIRQARCKTSPIEPGQPWTASPAYFIGRGPETANQTQKPTFPGRAVALKLIELAHGATVEDLAALSPNNWNPDFEAHAILNLLWKPDEFLFIGNAFSKRVLKVSQWLDLIEAEIPWPHIIPNPLTGILHETKEGKLSLRCDSAVADYRFCLIEFDEMPRPDQIAFWFSIIDKNLLRVSAIVDSGGKSLHAWVRIDLPDRPAWDREIVQNFYEKDFGVLATMGADRASQNPSRLSRMPGHFRIEKGRKQKLLFLNAGA